MILSELKRHQDLTTDELVALFMERGGYTDLKRGQMGWAFFNPKRPDEVLKVWPFDSAYEGFVELAKSWAKNKHVPKFLSPVKELSLFHTRTSALPPKLKYVRMERLEHATKFVMDGHVYDVDLLTHMLIEHVSHDESELLADVERYLQEVAEAVDEPSGDQLRFYAQTAMMIVHEVLSNGAVADLDPRNVMRRRSDGAAVITDPGGYEDEIELSKLINRIESGEVDDPRYPVVKGKAQ